MKKFKRNLIGTLTQTQFEQVLASYTYVVQLSNEAGKTSTSNPTSINFSTIVAIGNENCKKHRVKDGVEQLKQFLNGVNDFVFGYFSYDLRTSLEQLNSKNQDAIGFDNFYFFVPDHILSKTEQGWDVYSNCTEMPTTATRKKLTAVFKKPFLMEKADYIHRVENLKQHIQFGDIYEVNYCVQHGFQQAGLEPYSVFKNLQATSPAPFSCYVKQGKRHLMCSSPERFLRKIGKNLMSQPIKGTNRRLKDNQPQKDKLLSDTKELSENVMITDLVRNDLSRSAKAGSVKVTELCKVYEFRHVNQMISTVEAELNENTHSIDAILNAFPMGSMTGAPKIRAMELIDQFEDFSRGLYSGAVGYFTPELDFDFNVVIRSILYNEQTKVVTFPTGGAITINSDPEKEYEECMLKAEAMRNVLLDED